MKERESKERESIDAFCHCLPPKFFEAANATLVKPLRMFQRAQRMPAMVDIDARLRVMDQFPGYAQLLSLASPTLETLAPPDKSPELARIGNDCLAQWVQLQPDRFLGFIASLPMNHPEAAMAEADRAVSQLGAVGIQLYTNVAGHPLDRPDLYPVVEHIASLGCPIWLHPIRKMTVADYEDEPVSKFDLWWAFGWPYETSLAMGRLVFAGLFDRWPDQIVITHHCGGTVPLAEGRLASGLELLGTRNPPQWADAVRTDLEERPIDAFRRFYADTASFGSAAAIRCAEAFFGQDQMLFGTDMPFDPEQGPGYIRDTLQAIDALELNETRRAAMLSGNLRRIVDLPGG